MSLAPVLAVAGIGVAFAMRQASASAQAAADAPASDATAPTWSDQWTQDNTPPTDNFAGLPDPSTLDTVPTEDQTQTASTMDTIIATATGANWGSVTDAASNPNVRAFLDMIAFSEGTSGPDGYRYMFGYPQNPERLITSYADHPRQYFSFTNSRNQTLKTSAAGRYQFLASTWDALKSKLGLQDFSPASQDLGAIELIRERGALNDVKNGRIASAITKCAPTWASLPGAGYAQPERKQSDLIAAYTAAGGQLLTA
jgi:lysozyme